MDEQRQDDQLETIYNSSMPIQEDVAFKTFREQWAIETDGDRGSGRFVLAVRHDDIYIYIYIFRSILYQLCKYLMICLYFKFSHSSRIIKNYYYYLLYKDIQL